MSFATMLNQIADGYVPPQPAKEKKKAAAAPVRDGPMRACVVARLAHVERRYKEAFDGKDKTTRQIAEALEIGIGSASHQLHRYCQRGMAEIVGTVPSTGTREMYLWRWLHGRDN